MRFVFLVVSILLFVGGSVSFQWSTDPEVLNVYVVPHSHNDPGWWYTFEHYHSMWTEHIISSVITALAEDPDRTFIWCEISFFSRWWDSQNASTRDTVKRLVKNKQLEFVGGGWVMNDEASVDIQQIINQYTAGHQWLLKNVGPESIPTKGWSIDPFGHSSAMAWALQEVGFDAMVINRVHKDIKESWNEEQKLEFLWDRPWKMQNKSCWDNTDKGMFTHMLAYKLYDIPNTCGPSWDICAEFDFERSVSKPITSSNVKERSETLMNQYRLKSKAFSHNHLLIPLGDDFKYKTVELTRKMMDNYKKIFDYVNANPHMKIRIHFSTLSTYFENVRKVPNYVPSLPTYDKDFFTYCDVRTDYWSGYYVTRPFLKKSIRVVSAALRSAQLLFSWLQPSFSSSQQIDIMKTLTKGSETLGLLQHHDAVTGTARQVVADDYVLKLNTARMNLNRVQERALELYSGCQNTPPTEGAQPVIILKNNQENVLIDSSQLLTISVGSEQEVVLLSSLSHSFSHVVRLSISIAENVNVNVRNNENNQPISYQLVPQIGSSNFYLYFFIELNALSVQSITLSGESGQISSESVSEVLQGAEALKEHVISNHYAEVHFDFQRGDLQHVTLLGNKQETIDMKHEYRMYSTNGGAYLFSPLGESVPLGDDSIRMVILIRGSLLQQWQVQSPGNRITTVTTLFKSKASELSERIQIDHLVDINHAMYNNKEVVSRMTTSTLKHPKFYTDSAALDVIERSFDENLPIQANFYPITSMVTRSNEGRTLAFTALVNQPLGVGVRSHDTMEFMLDRRTMQDDGRGMGERVADQRPITVTMWYIIERSDTTYSQNALRLKEYMDFPLSVYYADPAQWKSAKCSLKATRLLSTVLPPSVELFSIMPSGDTGTNVDLRFSQLHPSSSVAVIDVTKLFANNVIQIRSLEERSLALSHTIVNSKSITTVNLPPVSVRSYHAVIARNGTESHVTGNVQPVPPNPGNTNVKPVTPPAGNTNTKPVVPPTAPNPGNTNVKPTVPPIGNANGSVNANKPRRTIEDLKNLIDNFKPPVLQEPVVDANNNNDNNNNINNDNNNNNNDNDFAYKIPLFEPIEDKPQIDRTPPRLPIALSNSINHSAFGGEIVFPIVPGSVLFTLCGIILLYFSFMILSVSKRRRIN